MFIGIATVVDGSVVDAGVDFGCDETVLEGAAVTVEVAGAVAGFDVAALDEGADDATGAADVDVEVPDGAEVDGATDVDVVDGAVVGLTAVVDGGAA